MIALLLLLQDLPELPASPYRAAVSLERFVKREDGATVQDGEMLVRPGSALAFSSGTGKRLSQIVLRDGRAVERRAGEKLARVWDLSRPANFQPLDLWRLGPPELARLFEIRVDGPARAFPDSVAGRAPIVAPLRPGAGVVPDGADRAEGCARVVLVPRDAALRERIRSIRLSVDRSAGRILSAVVETPAQRTTITVSDVQELASLDDAAFEVDLNGLNVEER